jgi:creatinine amidohydrolase
MTDTPIVDMSQLTWTEYRDRLGGGCPVVLPVGAVEQHGPHLPLGTDWMVVQEICREVAVAIGGVAAPPVIYGYKSHLRTGGGDLFPGTTNLSGAALTTVVSEILGEFIRHGARQLLVVNGHYENEWFVREACDLAADAGLGGARQPRIVFLNWWDPGDDGYIATIYPSKEPMRPELQHASWVETSMMLHLFPELVRRDAYPPDELAKYPPYDVFPSNFEWLPPSGAQSAISPSTKEAGRALVEHYVAGIVAAARAEFVIATGLKASEIEAKGGNDV